VRRKPRINAWIAWREGSGVHTRWRLPPSVGRLRQALAKSWRNWPHEPVGSFSAGEQNFRLRFGVVGVNKAAKCAPNLTSA